MRRVPRTVWALAMTSLFTDASSEMVFPLIPVFLASLGGGAAFLGLVEGVADALSSVLKLISGRLADRPNPRKPLVVFGYGLASFVRPLVGFATAPFHVLAIRVVDRMGKGLRTSPRDVLIASAVPATEAGRAFGVQRAMDHVGAIVGPILATALLSMGFSVRAVFFCAAAPAALAMLSLAFVREPDGAPRERAPRAAAGAPRGPLPTQLKRYLAILCLFSLGNSTDAFLLLRARSLGVDEAALPLLWVVLHIAKVVSSYLGGGAADRIPRARLIAAGWVVYAAAYLGLAFAEEGWQAWTLFAFYGLYHGLTEPAEKALVGDLAPDGARGRAFGAYNFLVGISAIPAGLLMGAVWELVSPRAALGLGAGLAALAMLFLVGWERSSRGARARRAAS